MKKDFKWVALMTLPILFLFFIRVSYANSSSQVTATVTVIKNPASMICQPNPNIVGSIESKFTCYIELSNADVSKIIPSTIRLSLGEISITPIPVSKDSPNSVGDFFKNGIHELEVTFDKKTVDKWFSTLFLPQNFMFIITGSINGAPNSFIIQEQILVINPEITLVKFLGQGGNVNVIKGIDFSTAKITSSMIDGTILQDVSFTKVKQGSTQVTVPVIDKTVHISGDVYGTIPVIIFQRTLMTIPFSAWARYDGSNCTLIPKSFVSCDGPGKFYKNLLFGQTEENAYIHFQTNGKLASITAWEGDTKVFEQINIPLKNFDFTIIPRLGLP